MKKIILALITFSVIGNSNISLAQENNIDDYNIIGQKIIKSYKNKDYKAFSESFNKDLSNFLSQDKIKEVIESLKSELGEIINIEDVVILDSKNILYPLTFEKGKLNLILSFDNQNKVSGILFKEPNLVIKYPNVNEKTTIDEIVEPYMDKKENMGLAIGIIDSKNNIIEHYYGKVASNKQKPDSNTLFEIGSITKVFTTTSLAKLTVEGKIKLSDYLDSFVKAPNFNGHKILLENLATQTSGLPRLPSDLLNTKVDPLNPYSEYTREQMYNSLKNYKLTRKPGESYEYSNFAMGILGDVLSTIEKKDYDSFIKDEILIPLNMKDTGVNLSRFQLKNMAKPHNNKDEPVLMWDFKSMEGAGAIKSNIADMIKFLNANINLNTSLKSSFDLAQKTHFKNESVEIGLGWHKNNFNGDVLIWHNGGTGGFSSFLGFLKNKKVGVIVLSNSANSVDDIGSLIIKRLILDK